MSLLYQRLCPSQPELEVFGFACLLLQERPDGSAILDQRQSTPLERLLAARDEQRLSLLLPRLGLTYCDFTTSGPKLRNRPLLLLPPDRPDLVEQAWEQANASADWSWVIGQLLDPEAPEKMPKGPHHVWRDATSKAAVSLGLPGFASWSTRGYDPANWRRLAEGLAAQRHPGLEPHEQLRRFLCELPWMGLARREQVEPWLRDCLSPDGRLDQHTVRFSPLAPSEPAPVLDMVDHLHMRRVILNPLADGWQVWLLRSNSVAERQQIVDPTKAAEFKQMKLAGDEILPLMRSFYRDERDFERSNNPTSSPDEGGLRWRRTDSERIPLCHTTRSLSRLEQPLARFYPALSDQEGPGGLSPRSLDYSQRSGLMARAQRLGIPARHKMNIGELRAAIAHTSARQAPVRELLSGRSGALLSDSNPVHQDERLWESYDALESLTAHRLPSGLVVEGLAAQPTRLRDEVRCLHASLPANPFAS